MTESYGGLSLVNCVVKEQHTEVNRTNGYSRREKSHRVLTEMLLLMMLSNVRSYDKLHPYTLQCEGEGLC